MQTRTRKRNFLRFLGYVKPYRRFVVLGAAGGVIKFTLPLFVPVLLRHLIDRVFPNPALSNDEKISSLVFFIGFMIGAFILVYAPGTLIRHYCADRASHRTVFDLREALYYHILRLSTSFFNRNQSGGLVARIMSDVALAQNLVGNALTNIWIDGFALFVALYFIISIDPVTACVALIVFPLYILFFKTMRNRMKTHSAEIQKNIERMSGSVQEKIAGSLVVKAFTREKEEEALFSNQSERLFETTMKSVGLHSLNMSVSGLFTNVAPLLVILVGGLRVVMGDLSLGSLVALSMYLAPLYLPIQRFSELNVILSNGLAALDRIFELMDKKPEIADPPDAPELAFVRGETRFHNVSFEYNSMAPVLHNISFSARPGERIAFVGSSGSGKSTLVSLIPRFYDVTAGSVTLDDVDIRTIRLSSLRKAISVVLQDPVLFSGTIRENVLYGNPHAADKELAEALAMANADSFVAALPQGVDTETGERGVLLSGGQKQRLTIARAFLKNPRVLILDEATAALDSESELLIQDALERLMEGRTTFIIAHRLSTVMKSDRIIVLDKGRIVEEGTHQELIARDNIYARYWRLQLAPNDADLLQPETGDDRA